MITLPIAAVIPTLNRAEVLRRTLDSLVTQELLPSQVIVIDGSPDDSTRRVLDEWSKRHSVSTEVNWEKAKELGAAVQRNQGVVLAKQPFIWFFDDDIVFEANCLRLLWQAIESDEALGGVNAMITNQRYAKPGTLSRTLFRTLHGWAETSYAGKCIGPALNLLPEDDPALPEVVPVEWLNTTCTIYRRDALPTPPFAEHFTGYSLMEDLALSLTVGKSWKLANVRTARIFHDTQPGEHKNSVLKMASMELVNRHYVMTSVLGRRGFVNHLKLMLLEMFGVLTPLASPRAWKCFPAVVAGKIQGLWTIATQTPETGRDDVIPRVTERVALKD